MRSFRSLLIGIGSATIGSAYLGLVAYAARVGPWPKTVARPLAFVVAVAALAWYAIGLAGFLFRPGGWAEVALRLPAKVALQLRRAILVLVVAGVAFLMPEQLLGRNLIAPGGRPVSAWAVCRLLTLAFEITVWVVLYRLVRSKSALVAWLTRNPERLGWLGRHRRPATWAALAAVGAVMGLGVGGYNFTASRLATAGGQSVVLLATCWGIYWLLLRAIDHHAWRWIRPGRGPGAAGTPSEDPGHPGDRAGRLRRLAGLVIPTLGLLAVAWVWEVDLALFHTLGKFPLWAFHENGVVTIAITLGDVTKAAVAMLITAVVWRHLGDALALAVFPRLPDDPGLRFAVLTLGRYLALGLGLLASLTALHQGLKQMGMVLAALGVGLGFGLQEIVSNFVSGIILLLERPIRVGDVVTVAGTTGKVDRINIRATTIINGDNQSMIVPNREFITGNLINWTHKDKIVRITLRVSVAFGADPDRVSDLLLAIVREDADVLRNPVPSAAMEGFAESAMSFVLYVFVPEPSLVGRVRHRLYARIQRRFEESGIIIPYPSRELHLRTVPAESALGVPTPRGLNRRDPASAPAPTRRPAPTVVPVPHNHCVDE